jgi:hypothetical protein
MAEDKYSILQNAKFPLQTDSFEEKTRPEWGINLARAIESEQFYRATSGLCRFYTQRQQIIERRIYSRGEQSMEKFKAKIGVNGDKSFLNLPKKPLTLIPKLVDVVCNGFSNRQFSIKAFSIDPASQEDRTEYRRKIKADMKGQAIINSFKNDLGIDPSSFPQDKLPETEEELNLHMEMEYKPAIEMSMEMAIDTVFNENKYDTTTKKRLIRDLVVVGKASGKTRYVPNKGIKIEYVDVENKIDPYSEDPYFQDIHYDGEIKQVLLSEIFSEYPDLTQDEKERITGSSTYWTQYHNLNESERLKGTAYLLYFTYLTTRERTKKIKTKETGTKLVLPANYKGDPNKRPDIKLTKVVEEIEMEGVYVLGTNILLEWGVSENMIRPKSNKQKVIRKYINIAPEKEKTFYNSLVNRMIPVEDELNVIELKTAQLVRQITPDGYEINLAVLANLDLGHGQMEPKDHFDLLMQTGSAFSSIDEEGNVRRAITELKTGDSSGKLQALGNRRMMLLDTMRDVIGLNKMSDASTPDRDSLVGIQKLASLNSNTATRHILDALNYMTIEIAEAVCYRVSDLLKFSNIKEEFVRKIGVFAVQDLENIRELHIHDFAIFLELEGDDEEKAKLEADLTKEIDKGVLGVEDKYKILSIKNLKYAMSYLSVLKKRKAKLDEERQIRLFQEQAKANMEASQASEQFKQQTAQIEAQQKAEVAKMTGTYEIEKEKTRGNENRLTTNVEYDRKEFLQLIINQGAIEKKEIEEKEKKQRALQEGTIQSDLIDQRQKDKDPIDFEAKNAGLEMFEANSLIE